MIKVLLTLFILIMFGFGTLYSLIVDDNEMMINIFFFIGIIAIYQIWKNYNEGLNMGLYETLKDTQEVTRKELHEIEKVRVFSKNHTKHSIAIKTEGSPSSETSFEATMSLSKKELNKVVDFIYNMKG